MKKNLILSFISATLLLQSQTSMATESLSAFAHSEKLENKTSVHGLTQAEPNDYEGSGSLVQTFSLRSFFKFEDVIARLHLDVEKETDIIYLVNTSLQKNLCEKLSIFSLPGQHLTIIKKINKDQPMFIRDEQNKVVDYNYSNIEFATLSMNNGTVDFLKEPQFKNQEQLSDAVTAYVPVSTGTRGNSSILTFSGIFRINEVKTNAKRKSTNTAQDPMQFSVYINAEYDSGKESGLALHGTPTRFWHLLGQNQASHGCIRLQTNFSSWNQNLLFEKNSQGELVGRSEYVDNIHVWNRRDLFPPDQDKFNSLSTGKKLKALVVMFDGYKSQCL